MDRYKGLAVIICLISLLLNFIDARSATTVYTMNQPVKGKGWIITVISAKNEGIEIAEGSETLKAAKPDSHLLRLKVNLKSLDDEAVAGRYIVDAVVRDSKGKKYPCLATGFPGFHIDLSTAGHQTVLTPMNSETKVDYIFTIPYQVKIVDFIWNDFPPIRLAVE